MSLLGDISQYLVLPNFDPNLPGYQGPSTNPNGTTILNLPPVNSTVPSGNLSPLPTNSGGQSTVPINGSNDGPPPSTGNILLDYLNWYAWTTGTYVGTAEGAGVGAANQQLGNTLTQGIMQPIVNTANKLDRYILLGVILAVTIYALIQPDMSDIGKSIGEALKNGKGAAVLAE